MMEALLPKHTSQPSTDGQTAKKVKQTPLGGAINQPPTSLPFQNSMSTEQKKKKNFLKLPIFMYREFFNLVISRIRHHRVGGVVTHYSAMMLFTTQ
jgi:hypothetical protein